MFPTSRFLGPRAAWTALLLLALPIACGGAAPAAPPAAPAHAEPADAHSGSADAHPAHGDAHPAHGDAHPAHGGAHPGHGGAHPGRGHGHGHGHGHAGAAAGAAAGTNIDAQLQEVARVHGGAGPWAVAGYRMGRHALARLGLEPHSFDLEVIHHSPRSVQFTCIADGAAAATGASMGKLNLSLVEAEEARVATTYRRKSTGASLTLRPTQAFRARFLDVPRGDLPAAGRAVMEMPDAEVFEEVR